MNMPLNITLIKSDDPLGGWGGGIILAESMMLVVESMMLVVD